MFHLFAEKPPLSRFTQFCVSGQLADVITRAKFYFNRIRSFDSVGGRIFGYPIEKKSRR